MAKVVVVAALGWFGSTDAQARTPSTQPTSQPTSQPASNLTKVAMDTRALSRAAYLRFALLELQRRLALRLTSSGFAVVAVGRFPDVRLAFLSASKSELTIAARARHRACTTKKTIKLSPNERRDDFHLEIVHKALAMARKARACLQDVNAKAARLAARAVASQKRKRLSSKKVAGKVSARSEAPKEQPPTFWSSLRLDLSAGPGVLLRDGGADLLLRAAARLGPELGFAARGAVEVAPSIVSGITAVDISVQIGASYRFLLTPTLYFDFGLLAGVHQHLYSIGEQDDGVRWDFLGSGFVELAWRPARRLGLELYLAPGWAHRSSSHITLSGARYDRSGLRFAAILQATLFLF